MVRLKHLFDPAVEAFDHAVGLGMLRWGQAVFDAEIGAELVELVPACCGAFAQTEQTVGEFLAVVRKYGADVHRAGPFQ